MIYYLPSDYKIENHPELTDIKTISYIDFSESHNNINIVKQKDKFVIKYFDYFSKSKINKIEIPTLNKETITTKEIDYLIQTLQIYYPSQFIKDISDELKIYKEKLEIKYGFKEENHELDFINPSILIEKDFNKIIKSVIDNQDKYFENIINEFEQNIILKERKKVKFLNKE